MGRGNQLPRWLAAVLVGCGCLVALLVGVVVAVVAFGSFLLPSIEGPLLEDFTEGFVEDLPKKLISEEFPEAEPFLTPGKADVVRKTVTIRVTGAPGMSFSGNYTAGVSINSIEGITPQDYQAEVRTGVDSVVAHVQKQGNGKEELTLQGIVDGEVVKEESTTAQSGVVWMTLRADDF